jgi:hypothetical protein
VSGTSWRTFCEGVSLRRGRLVVGLSDAEILKLGMAVDRSGGMSVNDMLL